MNVAIGDTCKLYRICKICGETKYLKRFPAKIGKRSGVGTRKSYCLECKDLKHERRLTTVNYRFNVDELDASNSITLRGPRSDSNYRYERLITFDTAKKLIEEGAAGIVHSTLIHHFFNKEMFKKFILNRDNYQCHYCGQYGDTVDHKNPRSNGGLGTPDNCVCACYQCNFRKKSTLYEDYLKKIGDNHFKGAIKDDKTNHK